LGKTAPPTTKSIWATAIPKTEVPHNEILHAGLDLCEINVVSGRCIRHHMPIKIAKPAVTHAATNKIIPASALPAISAAKPSPTCGPASRSAIDA
jgi:hypothetical protein